MGLTVVVVVVVGVFAVVVVDIVVDIVVVVVVGDICEVENRQIACSLKKTKAVCIYCFGHGWSDTATESRDDVACLY